MNFRYFHNLSVTIIGTVTAIFILTTVGGLFHIPINPFYVLIPFIGGLYYLKKQSPENIDFLKQFLILLLIVYISFILAMLVWDTSFDGRWYHTGTIVMLKKNWLPVYQNYVDFSEVFHVFPTSAFWSSCYVHFIEIIDSNIYRITNLIESTKTTNFIILSAVFMYSYTVLKEFKYNNKFILFIFSLIIVFNPVCICQWFTNFIDLHIYFAFTLVILTIIKTELQQNADRTDLFMFVCSSLMLAMTKFTGCMYLFLICLIYIIYLILLKRNVIKFIKTVLITGSLIALTGVNPFFTNIRDYGNPFHPICGKNKTDVVYNNIPSDLENMSKAERFLRSTFSESVNAMNSNVNKVLQKPVKLKFPFTIQGTSFMHTFAFADMRVGGFGYFWSGILLLSLFYLLFIRFRNKNEKFLFWLITVIITVSTFVNPHCWWARLVPQFWLLPFFIMFFGLLQENYKNIFSKILKLSLLYFIAFTLIINCSVVLYQNTKSSIYITKLLKRPFEFIYTIKKSKDKIYLMTGSDQQLILADETIIPHLEEYFGKENIIYVPYNKKKIILHEYTPIQNIPIHTPCYFFKIAE